MGLQFKVWVANVKFASFKALRDCNLNLITVGKLNTEVNRYVPFWQTTILNEQNVSFPLYLQQSLYVGSLLQLCSFCFTANVLNNIMDNFDNA